jgi:hypothetical protein
MHPNHCPYCVEGNDFIAMVIRLLTAFVCAADMLLFPVFPTINALAITAAITAAKKAGSPTQRNPLGPRHYSSALA